jgi:DNA-binding HxlR family transcriptional regulator
MLIIRELLAGPRRYKDLLEGLPEISTNLLAERLRSLEAQGLLIRRVLPPPAGSTVYELTERGWALENVLLELGKWGAPLLPPSLEGVAPPSLGAIRLALKAFFHPEQAQGVDESYELHLGREVLQVQVKDGSLQVRQGPASRPAGVFHTEMETFLGLFTGQLQPAEAVSRGLLVRVEGDPGALERFLSCCQVSASPPA